jgi:AraC-like DNA-binding protein
MELSIFNDSVPKIDYFKHRTLTPDWQIDFAKTDYIDLTYITGGQAVYTINRQKIYAEEGDLLCIPKGSERTAMSGDPIKFECFAANFNMFSLKGEEVGVPLPVLSHVGKQNDLIAMYHNLNEDFSSRTDGYVMRARARFMLILQRFMEMLVYNADTFQFDPRVKQAIRYITEHYIDHLSIATVAAEVSLNPVYFGTLFKRETGVTFRDYLNTVRINQAENMLRAGKWNVTEVAGFCGFTDVFYFSRLFKKHKGVPPSAVNG